MSGEYLHRGQWCSMIRYETRDGPMDDKEIRVDQCLIEAEFARLNEWKYPSLRALGQKKKKPAEVV